jgi:hypothetical protein
LKCEIKITPSSTTWGPVLFPGFRLEALAKYNPRIERKAEIYRPGETIFANMLISDKADREKEAHRQAENSRCRGAKKMNRSK